MSSPDIQASLENAEEIARLTNRSKSDVIADLLDDGKLNNSNAIKENTSAIDRATQMANKTHKLLTALIPILILLSTSGLELTGIIDLTPAGEGDDDEWFWEDEEGNEYDDMIWGCTNDAAENYDPEANVDDGSCIPYEEDCEPFYYDNYTVYVNNQTEIQFNYDVDINCDEEQEVEVQFLVYKTNSTNGDMPENYSIDIWDVYNGDVGYRNITLGNFTTGYYDVYSYLINDDGEMITELIWYDVELLARD
tara:strand:- start:151 stop:903 length:753 start_codon:yes stop_codon:yes gene_type:complete